MTTIDAGEGWRLLSRGEIKVAGDEFLYFGKWLPCHYIGNKHDGGCTRRRIGPAVEVHTGGPYIAIEVHRAALAEIERLKAELDAVKHPQPSPEPKWFDLTPFGEHVLRRNIDWGGCDPKDWRLPNWPPVTTTVDTAKSWGWEQFRCLLKDAPPELVAMASKPAEDPDEWVTQDRVPVRVGIDDCRWCSSNTNGLWFTVMNHHRIKLMHGEHDGSDGLRLEVRCRRRDLPPMPEKPKTETVTFYECIIGGVGSRFLEWTEKPEERHGVFAVTGRTETREVVR